jgi:hypothetical protein
MRWLREDHLTCLQAVDGQRATVDAVGFAIDGRDLTGDLHMAMAGLHRLELVFGEPGPDGPELLWLTEAGEQALARGRQHSMGSDVR